MHHLRPLHPRSRRLANGRPDYAVECLRDLGGVAATLGWCFRVQAWETTGVGVRVLPLQKCAKLFQKHPPGRFIREKKVIGAG